MKDHSAKPHPLDHVVLPVVNIDLARERLGKLGFTVAADARHPFGTENACVFFADKTYLEPLGVASVEESELSARQGNVFTARNQAFRFRCGEEGLSAIAFGTGDCGLDHKSFIDKGSSAGKMLEFSRTMKMPDGSESIGSFRLAFCRRSPRARSPSICRRARQPVAGRSRFAGKACQWRHRYC